MRDIKTQSLRLEIRFLYPKKPESGFSLRLLVKTGMQSAWKAAKLFRDHNVRQ